MHVFTIRKCILKEPIFYGDITKNFEVYRWYRSLSCGRSHLLATLSSK